MLKANYNTRIGSATLNSLQDPNTQIKNIEVQTCIAPFVDFAKIVVGYISRIEDGLAGQALAEGVSALSTGGASSASAEIDGTSVNVEDDVTIELGYEDNLIQVFKGMLTDIEPNISTTIFTGSNDDDSMTKTRVNQTYQNQTAGQIVSDLANQASVDTDVIENGINFAYYVVDDRKHVLQHAVELAEKSGLDLYFTAENKLTMKKFQKSNADHTFTYGEDIIELHILNNTPIIGQVLVSGESPASSQGNDAWHWFAKDTSSFQGSAGDGSALLIQEPSIRTKEAADTYAAGKLDLATRASTMGRIKITGNPAVKLGDAIAIEGVPTENLNGLFQVRRIKHQLSKNSGFITTIYFIAASGGNGLGGLL